MYTYLTARNGPRAGSSFLLDPALQNRIGRGTDCQIVLSDPLCSRVHATVVYQDDSWWLHDASSSNGTYLNDHKIDEARLVEGCIVRLGSLQFAFHSDKNRPHDVGHPNFALTKTTEIERPFETPASATDLPIALLQDSEHVHDFLLVYQLSVRLLECTDPDDAAQISLSVLQGLTGADAVGFLWMSDDGQMRLKMTVPDDACEQIPSGDDLTEIVCGKGQSLWLDSMRQKSRLTCLRHCTDAICVPLLRSDSTPGAIHLVRFEGSFRPSDFQFAQSVANVMTPTLVRTRHEAALLAKHQRLVDKTADFDELIGDSEPMKLLKARITRVARATGCLLIRGESGSGKELVARAVHRCGTRADRPLLSVNCAAIPPDLMESQLFGHKRGAFTGADTDHVGWFEHADSGTLFLDEVGELTLEGQAKLLRILDGYPFLPVGSSKERTVDVRVIAATNRDLRDFVREKRFREDLYYRLSVFELVLPPLRERGSDIDLLIQFFLDRFRHEHGRPHLQLSDEAHHQLLAYSWPGNVRQLRNVLDSAVVMAEHDEIHLEDLGIRDAGDGDLESLRVDFWERRLIVEALKRTGGNVPQAAKLLGLGRATLYRKIDDYGVRR